MKITRIFTNSWCNALPERNVCVTEKIKKNAKNANFECDFEINIGNIPFSSSIVSVKEVARILDEEGI